MSLMSSAICRSCSDKSAASVMIMLRYCEGERSHVRATTAAAAAAAAAAAVASTHHHVLDSRNAHLQVVDPRMKAGIDLVARQRSMQRGLGVIVEHEQLLVRDDSPDNGRLAIESKHAIEMECH